MRTLVLPVILVLSAFNARGQNNNKLLEAFINDSAFCKYVMTCNQCDTIYIVDTAHYFDQNVEMPGKKKVIITTNFTTKPQFPWNRTEYQEWLCKSFFITDLKRRKKFYRLTYFHPPTNEQGFIEYKFKKGRWSKGKYQFGVF